MTVRISLAQSATAKPDTKWWWAWRESSRELIAFNAEGDSSVIATDLASIHRFARVSNDTAFAVLEIGGEFAPYKLTPQSAVRINFPTEVSFSPNANGYTAFGIAATQGAYVVLTTYTQLWIYDLNTNEVQAVDRALTSNGCSNCVGFYRNGRFLRYPAPPSSDESEAQFVVQERELATGVERTLYIARGEPGAKNVSINCKEGAQGERWLCSGHSEFSNYGVDAVWLVDLRGQTRTLLAQSLFSYTWQIYYSRDSLIILDERCMQDCTIEIETQAGYPAQSFKLPPQSLIPSDIYGVIPLSNENLLLGAQGKNFILSKAGQLQELGYTYCCEALDTKSPDLHWIVLATDAGASATVWDLETSQAKFVIHDSIWPNIVYTDSGFIVSDQLSDEKRSPSWVYFNNADSLLEISTDENGSFTDMLPDHALIYEQREDSTDLATGIYRYDTESKTYTPLVPGATFQFGY
ncbi:MAG: hypothetical protein ABI700_18915 [Chloroflexota bacterium]